MSGGYVMLKNTGREVDLFGRHHGPSSAVQLGTAGGFLRIDPQKEFLILDALFYSRHF